MIPQRNGNANRKGKTSLDVSVGPGRGGAVDTREPERRLRTARFLAVAMRGYAAHGGIEIAVVTDTESRHLKLLDVIYFLDQRGGGTVPGQRASRQQAIRCQRAIRDRPDRTVPHDPDQQSTPRLESERDNKAVPAEDLSDGFEAGFGEHRAILRVPIGHQYVLQRLEFAGDLCAALAVASLELVIPLDVEATED